MGDSRVVIPVLVGILILGVFGLSYDIFAFDVCYDGESSENARDGRCAHETMTEYGIMVYNNYTDRDLTSEQIDLLKEGAGHEDAWDHLFAHQDLAFGLGVTLGHFWDPDQQKICTSVDCVSPPHAIYLDDYDPSRLSVIDGAAMAIMAAQLVDGWPNGWQKTEMYWSMSLGEYAFNNLDGSCIGEGVFEGCGAYHYLGHVAHHFGDNTIPTHAHQSAHDPATTGTDAFENWMSGKKGPAGYLWTDDEEEDLKKPIGVYTTPSTGIDPLAAMTGDAIISSGKVMGPVDTQRDKLYWLLYTENQIADYFASDRVNGDGSAQFIDGKGYDPEGWVEADLNYLHNRVGPEDLPNDLWDLDNNNSDCIPPTIPGTGISIGDGTCGNDVDGDLSKIREYSYLRGIRSIAGLMELYDQTVTTKPILGLEISKIEIIDYQIEYELGVPTPNSVERNLSENCDDPPLTIIEPDRDCEAYAEINIGGKFITNVGQIVNVGVGSSVSPEWRFGKELEPSDALVLVNIRLFDEDTTALNADDDISIASGGSSNLSFRVNVEKCLNNESGSITSLFGTIEGKCGEEIVSSSGDTYDGTAGAKITFIVKMANLPPEADAGGPYSVTEGGTVTLDGSGSSDPNGDTLTYQWDLDYDGSFDVDATGQTFDYTDTDDNKLVNIALRVTDEDGASSIDSTTLTVLNVPPTVSGHGIFKGLDFNLLLLTTDPSNADTLAGFNYTIDWGDGSTCNDCSGDGNDIFVHTYSTGSYTVKVNATDKDDGVSQEFSIDVATPFVNIFDEISSLANDDTLNKGQENSFTSKLDTILKKIEQDNFTPACNVANAFINEVNAFVTSEKLTQVQGDDLIEQVEKQKDTIGCNAGVINIVKQTIPDGQADQFTFTGDVSGVIGDDQEIILRNLNNGTYSSTETIPADWSLVGIVCAANDFTANLVANSININLQENEYAVCVFFNEIEDTESSLQRTIQKENNSSFTNDVDQAVFFSLPGNSNPSSPQTSDDLTDDKKGSGGDEHLTRPTFGLSHETFETIVDSGFRFNDQSFTINDNHHTPFEQQTVNIGEVNTFEAKIYADKRLKVQEFLFGIPNVGEAHLAELGVEVWYDYNGNIEEVKAVQKSNVIDKETIEATHEKVKCQPSDSEEKCDSTKVSMKFLEPLKDKVMAVKAIDYKQRYQITYLNEGVDIAGESLNPMQTYLIPSNVRDGGLIKVTQLEKYSPYWQTDDGRMFEMNSFGSFKEVNQEFERFQDTGTAYTRVHSGFGGVINYELKRATEIFDGSELLKELPDFIPYTPPEISERMTGDMKQKMQEQEEIAKEILEKSKVQARW